MILDATEAVLGYFGFERLLTATSRWEGERIGMKN
jgi:hypothetical protein